jgi:hypothetical protein
LQEQIGKPHGKAIYRKLCNNLSQNISYSYFFFPNFFRSCAELAELMQYLEHLRRTCYTLINSTISNRSNSIEIFKSYIQWKNCIQRKRLSNLNKCILNSLISFLCFYLNSAAANDEVITDGKIFIQLVSRFALKQLVILL